MPYADRENRRKYAREWMRKRRASFMDGKACVFCTSAHDLVLHHLDPTQKESHRIWSWSEKRRNVELEKCVVLCRPCHVGFHHFLSNPVDPCSPFLGVSRAKNKSHPYEARISNDRRSVWLGYHATPEKAFAAYCSAAFEIRGTMPVRFDLLLLAR